ncbi:MAG: flotillin-like protein FloA [Vulcanimicrobiota bacterium]
MVELINGITFLGQSETVVISVLVILGVLIFLGGMILYFFPIQLYISAVSAKVPVSAGSIFGMRFRKVDPQQVVNTLIKAYKAGINLNTDQLETHYLAQGNIDRVIDALIAANKASIELDFERACAIDLAGRDVKEAVLMSVNPKVIDVKDLVGTALDGIQLSVNVRVTVRANIDRLVGGATQETIKARVGQGIVAEIGSSKSYKDVLENPDKISARVLNMGLDAGTAFEILSIDVADVDVGKNIGANLQATQAEADMRLAKAKAQERRSMAEAREQEMKALAEEMRARVIEAEADIPKALAEALRSGKMGFMDYYQLQNLKADTSMRTSIGGQTSSK